MGAAARVFPSLTGASQELETWLVCSVSSCRVACHRRVGGWMDGSCWIRFELISVAVDIKHVGFSFLDPLPSSLYKRS